MTLQPENLDQNSSMPRPQEPLRSVVFGSQARVLKQMSEQLARKKINCRMVNEEKMLLSTLSEFDPDLVFIEINGTTRSPIDQVVKVVFMWTKNYARRINRELNSPTQRLWDKAKVIMYKTDPEDQGLNPAGETITDVDEILFKCKEKGDVIYIGLYAPWSFYSKLLPVITAA